MTPIVATPPVARHHRKVRVGIVVSNRMQKTIVVRVTQLVRHPKYSRVIKQASTFKAHDENNQAAIGDWVKMMETRPLSRDKRWRLVEIVKRASSAPPLPGEEGQPKQVSRKHTAQASSTQQESRPG